MPHNLEVGLRHRHTILVDEDLTVPAVSATFLGFADMPPVFATAFLVGFIEWSCIEALKPFLAPEHRTVGTHIDVSHIAATPVGMRVTAEVQLIAVDGRRLRFEVECHDEKEPIGKGFHERAIIDRDKFIERVRRKGCCDV